jgi:uncharacterized damage-inducible protein DinB
VNNNTAASLWLYNRDLLGQASELIERLKSEALPTFQYSHAIGPHLRHIIEHYTALLNALANTPCLVDYDARDRDIQLQSEPDTTLAKLWELQATMRRFAETFGQHANLKHPMITRLQAGNTGELTIEVATTLGRELMFLSSHTVHHFALLGHFSKAAGVDMGHDFGKAPATLAYELKAA